MRYNPSGRKGLGMLPGDSRGTFTVKPGATMEVLEQIRKICLMCFNSHFCEWLILIASEEFGN